jgi:hypothetical protein
MGFQSGGAFLIGGDYSPTGAWNFVTAPTIGGSATVAGTSTIVGSTDTQTLTNKTLTSPTLTTPVVTGDGGSGFVVAKIVPFVEVATLTTHTGTVVVPAGALLLDIYFWSTVLWTATDAAVVIGDAASANGWFTTCQLDTTDLVVGERLQASNANNWGGVNGSYLTTAGLFGHTATTMMGGYCPTAYSVIGVVSKSGAGTAGRSFMMVTYAVGQSVAPVVA